MRRILVFLFWINLIVKSGSAQVLIIAHRGASAYEAENSAAAFKKAIEMKADYIELDVHQTKDSVVVVMHDKTINRTCKIPHDLKNKFGKRKINIKDMSFEDFRHLIFKNNSESPLSLDSTIKLINKRCKVLIEIKKGSEYYPGIEKNILKIIRDNHAQEWVDIIHSFNKKSLLKLKEEKSGIKLQKLYVLRSPLCSFRTEKNKADSLTNWDGVNVNAHFLTKRTIKRIHYCNASVFAWTVNNKRKAKRLIKLGVDGIITNKPDLLYQLIHSTNQH